jgi:hypothetical protein
MGEKISIINQFEKAFDRDMILFFPWHERPAAYLNALKKEHRRDALAAK